MSQLEKSQQSTEKQRIHKDKFATGKPRLITVKEVSHRTSLGQSTIHAKVAAGEFVQPIKVKAGVTRWLESDIDEWINNLVANNKAVV